MLQWFLWWLILNLIIDITTDSKFPTTTEKLVDVSNETQVTDATTGKNETSDQIEAYLMPIDKNLASSTIFDVKFPALSTPGKIFNMMIKSLMDLSDFFVKSLFGDRFLLRNVNIQWNKSYPFENNGSDLKNDTSAIPDVIKGFLSFAADLFENRFEYSGNVNNETDGNLVLNETHQDDVSNETESNSTSFDANSTVSIETSSSKERQVVKNDSGVQNNDNSTDVDDQSDSNNTVINNGTISNNSIDDKPDEKSIKNPESSTQNPEKPDSGILSTAVQSLLNYLTTPKPKKLVSKIKLYDYEVKKLNKKPTPPPEYKCQMRPYNYTAKIYDSQGRICSGQVQSQACFGSCRAHTVIRWIYCKLYRNFPIKHMI